KAGASVSFVRCSIIPEQFRNLHFDHCVPAKFISLKFTWSKVTSSKRELEKSMRLKSQCESLHLLKEEFKNVSLASFVPSKLQPRSIEWSSLQVRISALERSHSFSTMSVPSTCSSTAALSLELLSEHFFMELR